MSLDSIRPSRAVTTDPRAQLQRMAKAMESLFINKMFEAMRSSLPTSGASDDPAREMFTTLLDQQLAGVAAEQEHRGLGETLYHQLVRRWDAAESTPPRKGS